jgi:hypothetical protein
VNPRNISPKVVRARGRVGGLSRSRAADDPEFVDAQSDLAAANLEDVVSKTVAAGAILTREHDEAILAALAGVKRGDVA